jgi:hypothetical protein
MKESPSSAQEYPLLDAIDGILFRSAATSVIERVYPFPR